MGEKDELDQIMEDFSSTIEENNSHETQSERLERLHQEGEITDNEFELLQTELNENGGSRLEFSATPGGQEHDPVDLLPENIVTDIVGIYQNKGKAPCSDGPETNGFDLHIAALPSNASVSVSCSTIPNAKMNFTEREQIERFRECVAQNPPYEIGPDFTDGSPIMGVKFNVIPSGYDRELSDEDIITEINHLFRTISHTYGIPMSYLSASRIIVEPK